MSRPRAYGSRQRYGKRVRTPRRTTAPGRAFPTPLWTAHTTRRPQAPQAVIICLHKHDNASRISKTRDDRDGRRLTDTRRFAPTSVHLRRNRRSRSPESVFNFSGIRTAGVDSLQERFSPACKPIPVRTRGLRVTGEPRRSGGVLTGFLPGEAPPGRPAPWLDDPPRRSMGSRVTSPAPGAAAGGWRLG